MHRWVQTLNCWLRKVPVWPGYILGFVPAAWLIWLGVQNQLGPNPVKALEHELGIIGLQLLLASLLITPLLHVTRINLIRFRRLIGLMAFYYICLHFAVYLFLDLQLNWGQIVKDITKRPYIIVGTVSLLLLVPLAVTSNDWAIRKLASARWRLLHMLVYPAAILSGLHFVWLSKTWAVEPYAYTAAMITLVAWRPGRRWWKTRQRAAVQA